MSLKSSGIELEGLNKAISNRSQRFFLIKEDYDEEKKIDSLSSNTHSVSYAVLEEDNDQEDLESISSVIIEKLNEKNSPISLTVTKRNIIEFILIMIGSTAGVSYSSLATKEAGEQLALQYIFSGSTILSVGISRMWAFSRIIERFREDSPNLELESRTKRYLKHGIVNFFGVASSLSPGYAIYKYNGNYLCTLITLFSEYSLATCGFYEIHDYCSLDKIKKNVFRRSRNTQTKITKREELADLFDKTSIEVLVMQKDKYISFEREINDHLVLSPSSAIFLTSLQELMLSPDFITKKLKPEHYFSAFFYKILFNIIPISNLIVNIQLSYKSSQEINKSLLFTIPYITLTTIPAFVLGVVSVNSTVTDIYNECFGEKITKNSFLKNFYPKIYVSSNIMALFIAAGATSWGIYICKQILKDSPFSQADLFLTAAYALGIFVFESFAIRDFVTDISILHSQYFGGELVKKQIHMAKQFSKIAKNIKNTPKNSKITSSSSMVNYTVINQQHNCDDIVETIE